MKVEELLSAHQLKRTIARITVLELFYKHAFALSHAFIEKNTLHLDRVTLYRTLATFEEVGIIHKVIDDTGVLKYALCKEECHEHHTSHAHHHVHFQCGACGQTTCLETTIPPLQLEQGYKVEESYFVLKGICKTCNEKP